MHPDNQESTSGRTNNASFPYYFEKDIDYFSNVNPWRLSLQNLIFEERTSASNAVTLFT